MSFETGAPPPDHVPPVGIVDTRDVPDLQHPGAARPARGHDATTSILPGPPPGASTYRLRGTETTSVEDPPTD